MTTASLLLGIWVFPRQNLETPFRYADRILQNDSWSVGDRKGSAHVMFETLTVQYGERSEI